MSKIYMEYLKKKNIDREKYYLFKSGMFYIFIDDDAKRIIKYVPLKITNLNKEVVKCGFPVGSIDKYMEIFNNIGLDIEIVDVIKNISNVEEEIIKKIKRIDVDKITPAKALAILYTFKEKLDKDE